MTKTVGLEIKLKGDVGRKINRINADQIRDVKKINMHWKHAGAQQARVARSVQETVRQQHYLKKTSDLTAKSYKQQAKQTQLMVHMLRQNAANAKRMQQAINSINLRKAVSDSEKLHKNMSRTQKITQTGVAIAAGAGAAAMVAKPQLQKARTYDERVTYITANATAGQGMSVDQRMLKKSDLNRMIMGAVNAAGGTRDGSLSAADVMISSGAYNLKTLHKDLTSAVKTSVAANVGSDEAAKLAIAMKAFGIKDISLGNDMAVAGGHLGAFEAKDQARHLPEQLGLARQAGYHGIEGLQKIIALNQMAMSTASTPDIAGNNVTNLLQKLNTSEFDKAIASAITIQKGDPVKVKGSGKKSRQVFDWTEYAQIKKSQGIDGIEAFVQLLNRQMSHDVNYNAAKKSAESSKGNEQKAHFEAMAQMAMGSRLGGIIADRQALLAAIAISGDTQKRENLLKNMDVEKVRGRVDEEASFINANEFAKARMTEQQALNINNNLYQKVNGVLGEFHQKLSDFMAGHQELATAAYAATGALVAMSAAGAVGGIVNGGFGAKKGKGKFARLGSAGGKLAGKAGSVLRTGGGLLARGAVGAASTSGGMVLGAGAAGFGVGSVANKYLIEGTPAQDAIGEAMARLWSPFSETAREAVESNRKYDRMLEQQREANNLNRKLLGEMQKLANKPAPEIPAPAPTIVQLNGRQLATNMLDEANKMVGRGVLREN